MKVLQHETGTNQCPRALHTESLHSGDKASKFGYQGSDPAWRVRASGTARPPSVRVPVAPRSAPAHEWQQTGPSVNKDKKLHFVFTHACRSAKRHNAHLVVICAVLLVRLTIGLNMEAIVVSE